MMQPLDLPICSPCIAGAEAHMAEVQFSQQSIQAQHTHNAGMQSFLMPTSTQPSVTWRCSHGNIVVPSGAPEVESIPGNGYAVGIHWPTIIHASAYVVELLDHATMTSQHFTRAAPEGMPPILMDLRVEGLQPSSYAARLRCISPCGCESAYSAWSALSIVGVPSFSSLVAAPALQIVPQAAPLGAAAIAPEMMSHPCPPPPTAPPSFAKIAAPAVALPPIPEGSADLAGTIATQVQVDQSGPLTPPLRTASPHDLAKTVTADLPRSCPPPPSGPPSFSSGLALMNSLPPILEEMVDSFGNFSGDVLTLD